MARARRRWIREQGWLDTTRLVFIDETAITTNMVRLNGWSPCGERLVADAPMGHWETVTFIAGLRQTGIVAPMLIKGAMNGEAFLAYIEQCLAPTLKRGDIVVADNVSFHKVAGVEEALRGVGASLRFLPQYSPDLNPIELAFHPVKTCLRKAAERTIEGLHRCVRSFIRTLAPSECRRYCVKKTLKASCCTRDEGGPFGAVLQGKASNRHELLRLNTAVVNVMVKRRGIDRVRY